jgi:hypothetical protein
MSSATIERGAALDAGAGVAAPSAAPGAPPGLEGDRPEGLAIFAAFCYEDPDSFIGQYVSRTSAELAEGGTTVYLFARRPFPEDEPDIRTHAVGDCGDDDDLLGSVEEFTRRAANAFLSQIPAGTEGITLLGYEWSAVPTLSLLRAVRNLPAIASFHSLEWERSDMSGAMSWRIAEIELAGLREIGTILVHQASTAKMARRRLPECAGRIAAAHQFFAGGGPEGRTLDVPVGAPRRAAPVPTFE